MAFKYTYDEMLEKAYQDLPKKSEASTRFEIPTVTGLQQGNKTIIKNIHKIATHLRRPIEHLVKFLSRELAAPSELSGAEAAFTGKFRSEFLNQKIEKYVSEFVLCNQCGKPDTRLKKDRGLTFKLCEACGSKDAVRTIK